ncbi:MAG: saccharopine dehydrogenase NADP-binding domain-containing protein [Acidobacteria bacterium]|nr:saccharopine dehydrogenase NADP-binding domain-containing protein [Acidobacteriota bacterium]
MRMLVLGAGLQGAACALDLLQQPAVTSVTLADLHVDHLPKFLSGFGAPRFTTRALDVRDRAAVLAAMTGIDAVMSAVPYYFNGPLAELAIEAGAHFSDLGGNTEIVQHQKTLHDKAVARGVSVIPDCGLAPGMVNILSQYGIAQLDTTSSVRIYVGGLPQHPQPPLNYQVVYSLEGVLDYYTTPSWIVRDGKRATVTALSEVEPVDFPSPVGTLEAFHTAGGLSTMAFRYEGQIAEMEYKTLRYPGHAAIMEDVRDLGFFDLEPIEVKGVKVVPRDVAIAVLGPRLRKQDSPDLVALRVVVKGTKDGQPRTCAWQLVDRMDEARGVTAMMRTTGYSLAITGLLQAAKAIAPGVHTPDECMPAEQYIAELAARGVVIERTA